MRTRTALTAALVVVAAAGSLSPALAGPTGGVIKGSWTASATPDPTGDSPAGSMKCDPLTPTGRTTTTLKIPGPGVLTVALNNSLDWSGDLRDPSGDVLSDSDGGSPTDAEALFAKFKKKTTVTIGACNLEGEPSINVTYVFTPAKK